MKKLLLVLAIFFSMSNAFADRYEQYEGEWLSKQGSASVQCSRTLYDSFYNACYQNCHQRVWTSSYHREDGHVWYNGSWQYRSETRAWYRYYWQNFQRPVYCN